MENKNYVSKIVAVLMMVSAIPSQITMVQLPQNRLRPTSYEVKRAHILAAIKFVESSNGKFVNHEIVASGMHAKTSAIGAWGIMPITIIETVKKNPGLALRHPLLVRMTPHEVASYMEKYPGLDQEIASRHYDRLVRIFGQCPEKIGYAWLNGISGTKRALKEGKNLTEHWHVAKINKALDYEIVRNL